MAAAMSADGFFRLVDEFLTPSMAAWGYHRIGGTENDQPQSRGILTLASSGSAERGVAVSSSFRLYVFGFEAGGAEAKRLVDAADPESADELWLSYEPSTGDLDLRDWVDIAKGRVDWDPLTDTGPCSDAEVRRRLSALGQVVMYFARRH